MSIASPKWGLGRSLLILSPCLLGGFLLALREHYYLPLPETALINPRTNLPQISEARILGYAKYLSEDIGYRTVGTHEHALADTWMVQQAEEARRNCERVINQDKGRKLQCEVWRQEGSGTHRFDMMGKRLYKSYQNLTNIVVRISDGTDAGKEHALLLNSHLDSTLPSPGAADDAISVGIMLDCIRVLGDTPAWSPAHAVIFLFNNAEESLQDASHLFSTQHPIAHTVRAVINLEAAGTTGRELLFQATSEEMVEAYSHVPRPFGTIFANDVFNSGVMLSDTDFRQFEEYLDVPGLDIAIVGNSYLYHMRKDLVENIQAGVAQNMGENTLALIKYLTAPGSPIPKLANFERKKPHLVFYSLLSHFLMYRFSTAKLIYGALFLSALRLTRSVWSGQPRGILAVMTGLLGSILSANVVALIMQHGLGKGMSWFAGGHFAAIGLYAPATLLGGLASQLLLRTTDEKTVFSSVVILQAAAAVVVQLLNVGSAAMFFIASIPLFSSLLLNNVVFATRAGEVSLGAYVLGQSVQLMFGTLFLIPTLEVFVPLTGRLGNVPADNIVATLVSILGAQAMPLAIPFAHRFGRNSLRQMVIVLSAVTLASMAIYARKDVFDEMHQKRLFVLHLENVTTNERHLHIASADGAPRFHELVTDISAQFASPSVAEADPVPLIMNEYNADWDSLYPFSAFLSPYKIELSKDTHYTSPWTKSFRLVATNDVVDLAAGTRSFTLQVDHPGLIWTVISFDAHVLKWNLDNNPPPEYARHHVKEASFYKIDTWTLDLVVNGTGGILFNFIGMQENAMWPGKKAVKAQSGPAMQVLENLDAWLDEKTGGTVDAMLIGCVAGTVVV